MIKQYMFDHATGEHVGTYWRDGRRQGYRPEKGASRKTRVLSGVTVKEGMDALTEILDHFDWELWQLRRYITQEWNANVAA